MNRHNLCFLLGAAGAGVLLGLSSSFASAPEAALPTAAVLWLMAFFWIGEVMPLAATALIPLIAFPLLGVAPIKIVAQGYAHPAVFLLLGGFITARALENYDLHRRFALMILASIGGGKKHIIFGFMLAAFLISMWINNSATTLMLLPIALSIAMMVEREHKDILFRRLLLLGLAYGATIGGMTTLTGTAPNVLASSFLMDEGLGEISFVDWFLFAAPLTCALLPMAWWVLTHHLPRDAILAPQVQKDIRQSYADQASLTAAQKKVLVLFVSLIALWFMRRPLQAWLEMPLLNDSTIAIAIACLFFLVPSHKGSGLLKAQDLRHVSWDVLLLFGGTLALALMVRESGLTLWLGEAWGNETGKDALSVWGMMLILAGILLMTEFTSNTATIASLLPFLALVGGGQADILIPLSALAASGAFMLPVATPPNTIIYGTNEVPLTFMAKQGIRLNLAVWLILSLCVWLWT